MMIDVSGLPLKDCAQLVAEDTWFFDLSRKEGVNGRVVLNCTPLWEMEASAGISSPLKPSLPALVSFSDLGLPRVVF